MFFSTKSKGLTSLALIGVLTALPACTPAMESIAPFDTRHKISVAETFERMELYIREQKTNLTARDRSAMRQFVNLYGQEGDGAIYLNIPSNAAGSMGIRLAQTEIQNLIMQAGLSSAPVQTGQYYAPAGAPAPLVMSFRRLAVVPMNCSVSEDVTRTYNNQTLPSFGCMAQANLGAMVSDPRQLLENPQLGPRDNMSSNQALVNYQEGIEN